MYVYFKIMHQVSFQLSFYFSLKTTSSVNNRLVKRHKSLKYCYKVSFLTIGSQTDNNQRTNKTNGRRTFERRKKKRLDKVTKTPHGLLTRPEAVPSVSKSVATARRSWMEHSVIVLFISAASPPPGSNHSHKPSAPLTVQVQ